MSAKLIDLSGKRFGHLYVISFSHVGNNRQPFWDVVCDCGQLKKIRGATLRGDIGYGGAQSCGCVRKHGWRYSAEYTAYVNARSRCTNTKRATEWKNYGGRGIKFKFKNFPEFLAAVGPKPHPSLTLDRIDVNGHYEVGNLRWTTPLVQARNTRRSAGKFVTSKLVTSQASR